MKTESILVQTLCVPCGCRCRYCLLSWDGTAVGADWEQSTRFAQQFRQWLRKNRPELRFHFAFGYAMEHPDLRNALRFLRQIGSPQAEFQDRGTVLLSLHPSPYDISFRQASC